MPPLTPNLDLTSMPRLSAQKTNSKVKAQKASLLYNSFILANFKYCPFIWMFCGRTTNDKNNSVHKRALTELINDYTSSFEELLHRNEEVTIHDKIFKSLC